ncbi:MAG: DUF4401 domain-containing protein [Allomuricauda sp.]
MDKLVDKQEILRHIRAMEGEHFAFDEDAMFIEYQKREGERSNLVIKVLSVFGGILASLAFLGSLLLFELYDSPAGMLIVGGICIVAAIWLNKKIENLIIDTFSVSIYVLGIVLLIIGMFSLELHEDLINLCVIAIALGCLFVTQNYILSFISTLIVGGGILLLIISKDLYGAIQAYIVLYALILVYFFMAEAKLMTSSIQISKLYDPLRIGLVFSFLLGLVSLGKNDLVPISYDSLWMSSLMIILIILYLIRDKVAALGINSKKSVVWIYVLSVLTLLPTIFAPAISGSLLLVMLCFMVNYKTGLAIGIIALVYFVIQYYYDLNFTLLTKSIMLFVSGVLFLLFYVFLTKKIGANEKV